MMQHVDRFLNRFTMYRLTLYYLAALLALGSGVAAFLQFGSLMGQGSGAGRLLLRAVGGLFLIIPGFFTPSFLRGKVVAGARSEIFLKLGQGRPAVRHHGPAIGISVADETWW